MMLLRELRRCCHKLFGPGLIVCLVGYFSYHIVGGDRGLLALYRLNQELQQNYYHLRTLTEQQKQLEHKISLLRPTNLCRDLLEEQAKLLLGFAHPNEVVVLKSIVSY